MIPNFRGIEIMLYEIVSVIGEKISIPQMLKIDISPSI